MRATLDRLHKRIEELEARLSSYGMASRKKMHDRIEELEEALHYANGCCDLAMKHRDMAESRIEALEQALHDEKQATKSVIFNYKTMLGNEERQSKQLQRKHEALVDNIMEYLDVDAVEWATATGDPPVDIVDFANSIRALLEQEAWDDG